MARPDVTLEACTDGLSPQFTSLFPLGSRPFIRGGTAALEWVTNGDLSDGDLIEVRTDGTHSFGDISPTFQNASVIGRQTIMNNVENNWLDKYADDGEFIRGYAGGSFGQSPDAESPFYSIATTTLDSSPRVAAQGVCFKGLGFFGLQSGSEYGYFTWPSAYDAGSRTTRPNNKMFYASWTTYLATHESGTFYVSYEGLSGTFATGTNTKPTISGNNVVGNMDGNGERCTLVNGAETRQGYVRWIDSANSAVYIEIDYGNPVWTNTLVNGATVTGNTSGATLTLATSPINYSGIGKSARALMDSDITLPDTATVIVSSSRGVTGKIWHDGATYDEITTTAYHQPARTWIRKQLWVDYRATDGNLRIYVKYDNAATHEIVLPKYNIRTDLSPILANWGMEDPTRKGLISKWGELVSHTDMLSVIISDSPTFAGVDRGVAEPQIVTMKASGKIGLKLNKGNYDAISGKYLYILTSPDAAINSSGLLLSGV